MSKRILPDGAYDALQGLKSQADAAMQMLPGGDKIQAKQALSDAHRLIASNEIWVKRIMKALMQEKGKITVPDATNEWLESKFAEFRIN